MRRRRGRSPPGPRAICTIPSGQNRRLGIVGPCAASCRMRTSARRCSVPVAVRCIGGPPGTITGGPPARPTNFPIRRFETSFSCQRVPGFGSGMLMGRRRHARVEGRLHVLHGVAAAGDDRKRPDFVDALATKWTPAFGFDGEQPHFAIGPNHCTARSLGRVRIGPRWVGVEMPEHLRFGDLDPLNRPR